jgi:hypothetical protein
MGALDKILRRRNKSESDQLPEEAPQEQIVDDVSGEGRPEALESPGGPGPEGERGTGHPDEARERE